MFADAEGHSLGILGYQFTLLQASNSLLQFLQSHATHTKKILAIVLCAQYLKGRT